MARPAAGLTPGQRSFAQHLAGLTGLNSRAISAWMLAEESGGAAQRRQAQRNNNWLNIGYFDSGPGAITKDQAFRDPVRAAQYTAAFLKGQKGGAAPGIRAILKTAGQAPEQQLRAIAASPWASSHYGGAGRLTSLLKSAPAPGAVDGSAASTGGGGGSSGGGSTRTTTTTTPGVDNSLARLALVQGFLGNKNADVLDFAAQAKGLADVPSTTSTQTERLPGSAATSGAARGAAAGSGAAQALNWVHAKLADQSGSRETGGANQGKLAGFLNSRFGMSGAPWCAMFTSAAVTKGGAPPSARTASVAQVRAKAQAGQGYERGFIGAREARPGDLVLFGNQHIGMVTGVKNGQIQYVGGNQSNTVSRGSTRAGGNVSIVRPKYGARR
jgi:hypothetical protein